MNEIHPADLAKLRPQEPVIKYILRSAERSAGAAVCVDLGLRRVCWKMKRGRYGVETLCVIKNHSVPRPDFLRV